MVADVGCGPKMQSDTLSSYFACTHRVVSDGDCVPEMESGMPAATENSYPGWAKQGLVKLACAKLVQTPFYLLLDTDTFFVHYARAEDLFKQYLCTDFSPVCDTARKVGFQAKNDVYPLYHRTEDQVSLIAFPCTPCYAGQIT